MTDLVEFLLARVGEDESWAIEASREDNWLIEGGAQWRWGVGENWATGRLDPAEREFVTDDSDAALLSTEERMVDSARYTLPQVALRTDEVRTAVAGHIARHDPARVLAECEAKRRIVADANKAQWIGQQGHVSDYEQAELNTLRVVLVTLAQPYRDHSEFDPAWLLPDTLKERP